MKRTYFCPACKATLNPNVKVILAASVAERRGLILLSPQPGNYRAIIPEDLGLAQGSLVSFSCPVCQASLTSAQDERLVEICFRFSTGEEGIVNFSRKWGEYATYFISRDDIRSYGEHAEAYSNLNFFGAGNELD